MFVAVIVAVFVGWLDCLYVLVTWLCFLFRCACGLFVLVTADVLFGCICGSGCVFCGSGCGRRCSAYLWLWLWLCSWFMRVELCVLRVVRRVLVTALYCVCGVLVHIHAWGRGKA